MKTVNQAKEWINTYICQTEEEQELVDGFKDILDEVFVNHKNEVKQLHSNIELYKKNIAIWLMKKIKKLKKLISNIEKK